MYEVEKIVDCRINKNTGKKQYLVKWFNYDSSQNTWEPERNLSNVKNLTQKFDLESQKTTLKNSKQKSNSDLQDENQDKKSLGSFGDESQKAQKTSNFSSKKQQSKKSKAKKSPPTTDVPKKTKKDITITGMSIKDGTYIYKALVEGEVRWIRRSYLVPSYLEELCQFYEQNLVLKQ